MYNDLKSVFTFIILWPLEKPKIIFIIDSYSDYHSITSINSLFSYQEKKAKNANYIFPITQDIFK